MNAAPRRKLPRLALAAGGLGAGLLLAPVIAGLVLAPRPGAGRAPAHDPAEAGAARFLVALDRARAGRWEEARADLAAAAGAGVPEAPGHLAEVDRKLARAVAVARVRALLAAGDPVAAAGALGAADRSPPLAALESEVREAARRRRAELVAALAGESGEAGDARDALARLDEAFPSEATSAGPAPAAPGQTALARAVAAFRAGHLAEARSLAARCSAARCRTVAAALDTVERALPGGTRSGPVDPGAAAALEAAAGAVRRLGGSPPLEKALGAALAPWYHEAGVEALRRGDLAVARERFDRALAAWPGHPPSEREREALRARAREAFLAGYTEKDGSPEQARQKFRLVMTISGPDEEIHGKARRWLERLEPGAVPAPDPGAAGVGPAGERIARAARSFGAGAR